MRVSQMGGFKPRNLNNVMRAFLVGFTGFLLVRFFLLVVRVGKPIPEAAKDTAMIPVQFIGTAGSLVFQPNKWGDVVEIVTTMLKHVKDQRFNPRFTSAIMLSGYGDLVELSKQPEPAAGQEQAQTEPPNSTAQNLVIRGNRRLF